MIYFKNPETKLHREIWGSVVSTETGMAVLTVKETKYFDNFVERELAEKPTPTSTLAKLLDLRLILQISKEEAEKIRKEKEKTN